MVKVVHDLVLGAHTNGKVSSYMFTTSNCAFDLTVNSLILTTGIAQYQEAYWNVYEELDIQ